MKHLKLMKNILSFSLLFILSSTAFSQTYFSFNESDMIVSRNTYSLYKKSGIYEVPLKFSDDFYLLFRYSPTEGVYAVTIISPVKIADQAKFKLLINPENNKRPMDVEITISETTLSENLSKEFGRSYKNDTKFAPFVLNDRVFYAYVVALPNYDAPLINALTGSVSIINDNIETKFDFNTDMIRMIQDLGLIMNLYGLR